MTLFGSETGAEAETTGPAHRRTASGPAPGRVRLRMTLGYDGSGYRGFAAQPGQPTVAGALAQALEAVVGHGVEITCAGRTDAGVHASGQVIHFDLDPARARAAQAQPDLDAIRRACNRMLGPAVVVRQVVVAEPGFDARHSARWRRYRYLVLNREVPDPFLAGVSWHVDVPLDLHAMQAACDAIHGEHDFSAFCRRPADGISSTVRRVTHAEWRALAPLGQLPPRPPRRLPPGGETDPWAEHPELLAFEITASAFCHQMVRSLVGTMVDIGRGRRRAGDMSGILRGRDRAAAGSPAPPRGLCLEEVGY